MWKYLSKDQEREFLLSLHLINGENDQDIINKLYTISNNIEKNYKIYQIKKRNGKTRKIYEPNSNLKIIQKNILHNILEDRYISKYAKAYKKGISLNDNASPHINKDMILKLDIENFFNNITYMQVYCSCFPEKYFPKSIGTLLTNLCTYKEILPQGAPTSAYISNIIMLDFDIRIGEFCESRNISYTRYCDDMTFSGKFNKKEIIHLVNSELKKQGLNLNKDKITMITQKQRQIVTGIVVNVKPQVNIDYRKTIRQSIYYIKKYGLESHLKHLKISIPKEKYLNNLLGKINFVLQVDNTNKEFYEYKKYILKIMKDS